MNVKQLREQRLNLINQQKDLFDRAEKEERNLSSDELQQFDKVEVDLKEIRSNLEAAEKMKANLEARGVQNKPTTDKDEATKPEYKEVFWRGMRRGIADLSIEERSMMIQKRGTDPQTTTPDTAGGYLVPEGFSGELETTMAHWGGMIEVSRILRTASGNPIPWPTLDDTSVSGGILAETATAVVSDITLGNKQLDAYTYTSNIVKLSVELLQDDAINLSSELNDIFGRRLGTAMNAHFTTGTGSSQPNGVITAATVGTTSAAVAAVTRDELVNLVHSVNRAYRPAARWMMNDSTLAAIKKLAFGSADDRPLWQPSIREGEPDRLEGYAYTVNDDMASLGTGNKPIAFGDFSKYVIRVAGGPTMVRLNERYMDALHVGFIMYQRADGELIQANAIKVLQNA